MRFHCNSCKQDFTTLSDDKGKKFAFKHMMLDKMFCPHCHASNKSNIPKRALKTTRMRYQPKRRSMDTDDYAPPAIILHEQCQKRLCGNPMSIEGMEVMCEGCPSAFNCLTGNVDDGSLKSKEYAEDNTQALADMRAKLVEDAKVKVAEKKRDDEKDILKRLRLSLGNLGFRFIFQNGMTYARYQGTVWKLDMEDRRAIIAQTWHTEKAETIRKTLSNHGIKPMLAQKLLYWEIWLAAHNEE